jgi:hypothetical protein
VTRRSNVRAAVRLSPSLARAHFGIGVVLESRRQDRDAIDAFTAAVRSDPPSTKRGSAGQRPAPQQPRRRIARALRGGAPAQSGDIAGELRLRHWRSCGWGDTARRGIAWIGTRACLPTSRVLRALARVLAAAPDDSVRDGARALVLVKPLADAQRSPAVA